MRRTVAVAATALVLGSATARADVSVSSFSVAPSSPQAGGSPALAQDIQLASTPGDTVKDISLSLPPGLVANPTVGPACEPAALEAGGCPGGSRVDDGTSAVRVVTFGLPVEAPAELYLVTPWPGELARLGLVVAFGGVRVVSQAAVSARTSTDSGLDITFTNLPRTVPGTAQPLTIERVRLTLPGTANGTAFTRLPTSCTPAVTRLGGVSHAGTTFAAESTFVPTECDQLQFWPALSAKATLQTDGAAFGTTITQGPREAALRSTKLTLPAGLAPRLAAIGRACNLPDPAACPETATVGAATIATPLQAAPLAGRVVLVAGAPLPGLAIVLPPPFPLRLAGTTALGAGGLSATFAGVPDVPISSLRVAFTGGPGSLLTGSPALCAGTPRVQAEFAAHSGAASRVTVPLLVAGCPGSTPKATLSVRGIRRGRPVLGLDMAASGLRSAFVRLPRGLSVRSGGLARSLRVTAAGRVVRDAARVVDGRLQVRLRGSGTSRLGIRLTRPALRVSRALAARVRAGRPRRLAAWVTLGRTGRAPVTISARATPR